jgi:hypothetical protein
MSTELLNYLEKTERVRMILKNHGFIDLEFFWYSDGFYNSKWSDMSVACEKPDIQDSLTIWQFGFKSQNVKNKRLHLEALIPCFENYFQFELRFYPEIKLHDREGYMGPTAFITVSSILEEDLTNLQKHIDFILDQHEI